MKKQILFLSAVALLAFNTSCNKEDVLPDTNVTPTNPNPTNPTDPTDPGAGPTPVSPTISGVSGTLVSIIMKYTINHPQMPMPMVTESDIAVAAFPASNGSDLLPAGNVSVNGHALEKADNNAYYVSATAGLTPATLEFSNGSSDWSIGGAGSIAAFTYSHNVNFPTFDGELPSSITKSNGLTISLGGNVYNSDSVYLVIAAGNEYIQTAVGGNASSISFTAAELQNLPVVSDNTAFLQVVPFRITLETISGNQYAFIKQQAVVTSVNIQ